MMSLKPEESAVRLTALFKPILADPDLHSSHVYKILLSEFEYYHFVLTSLPQDSDYIAYVTQHKTTEGEE